MTNVRYAAIAYARKTLHHAAACVCTQMGGTAEQAFAAMEHAFAEATAAIAQLSAIVIVETDDCRVVSAVAVVIVVRSRI